MVCSQPGGIKESSMNRFRKYGISSGQNVLLSPSCRALTVAALHPKGTYILILQLENNKRIKIGRLGRFFFQKGWYTYVGSSFGPGGLSARIGHHLKKSATLHWHIDYLRKSAGIRSVWVCEQEKRLEHIAAGLLLKMAGASVPVPGFGSSDCKCESHLVHFQEYPELSELNSFLAEFTNQPSIQFSRFTGWTPRSRTLGNGI